MNPWLMQILLPLAVTAASGAVTFIVAQVGGATKKYLDTNVDSQLNVLLHAAIDRASDYFLSRANMTAPNMHSATAITPTSSAQIVKSIADSVRRTNPDTLKWFKLDANPAKLDELIQKAVDVKVAKPSVK